MKLSSKFNKKLASLGIVLVFLTQTMLIALNAHAENTFSSDVYNVYYSEIITSDLLENRDVLEILAENLIKSELTAETTKTKIDVVTIEEKFNKGKANIHKEKQKVEQQISETKANFKSTPDHLKPRLELGIRELKNKLDELNRILQQMEKTEPLIEKAKSGEASSVISWDEFKKDDRERTNFIKLVIGEITDPQDLFPRKAALVTHLRIYDINSTRDPFGEQSIETAKTRIIELYQAIGSYYKTKSDKTGNYEKPCRIQHSKYNHMNQKLLVNDDCMARPFGQPISPAKLLNVDQEIPSSTRNLGQLILVTKMFGDVLLTDGGVMLSNERTLPNDNYKGWYQQLSNNIHPQIIGYLVPDLNVNLFKAYEQAGILIRPPHIALTHSSDFDTPLKISQANVQPLLDGADFVTAPIITSLKPIVQHKIVDKTFREQKIKYTLFGVVIPTIEEIRYITDSGEILAITQAPTEAIESSAASQKIAGSRVTHDTVKSCQMKRNVADSLSCHEKVCTDAKKQHGSNNSIYKSCAGMYSKVLYSECSRPGANALECFERNCPKVAKLLGAGSRQHRKCMDRLNAYRMQKQLLEQ
ncbi:MAG: hypothetical protein CMK89_13550 [Pseudomonadales bacterium]|nr:hypothetical protein [Pseudomonadales bacterium]